MSRVDDVTEVVHSLAVGARFTVADIAPQLTQYQTEQIARTLQDLKVQGHVVCVGKVKRARGGMSMNVYERVRRIEHKPLDIEVGGVWAHLYMKPIPVPKGVGRVYEGA